jgi:hypothetical protein
VEVCLGDGDAGDNHEGDKGTTTARRSPPRRRSMTFRRLVADVKDELSLILRGRRDLEVGFIQAGSEDQRTLQERERKRTDQGIDIDRLFSRSRTHTSTDLHPRP